VLIGLVHVMSYGKQRGRHGYTAVDVCLVRDLGKRRQRMRLLSTLVPSLEEPEGFTIRRSRAERLGASRRLSDTTTWA
jgi:hypothetical protein